MKNRKRITENLFGLPFSNIRIPVNGNENGKCFPFTVIVFGFFPLSHTKNAKSKMCFSCNLLVSIMIFRFEISVFRNIEIQRTNGRKDNRYPFSDSHFSFSEKLKKRKLMKSGKRQTFSVFVFGFHVFKYEKWNKNKNKKR